MDKNQQEIIVFTLAQLRCGIRLDAVERVVRMVEITPLPGLLALVLGVVNVQGRVMPVLDLRQRFGMEQRPLELSDQLIITYWAGRHLALSVDNVTEVRDCPEQYQITADTILPHLPFLAGVVKSADGLILIHDLDQLISDQDFRIIQELVEQDQP